MTKNIGAKRSGGSLDFIFGAYLDSLTELFYLFLR